MYKCKSSEDSQKLYMIHKKTKKCPLNNIYVYRFERKCFVNPTTIHGWGGGGKSLGGGWLKKGRVVDEGGGACMDKVDECL